MSGGRADILCRAAALAGDEPQSLTPWSRESKCVPNVAIEPVRIARKGELSVKSPQLTGERSPGGRIRFDDLTVVDVSTP